MGAISDPANGMLDRVNQYNDSGFRPFLDEHMTQETFSSLKASLFWSFLANDLFIFLSPSRLVLKSDSPVKMVRRADKGPCQTHVPCLTVTE